MSTSALTLVVAVAIGSPARADSTSGAAAAPKAVAAPQAVTPAAGSWGFDMNGNGCNGTAFASGAAPSGVSNVSTLAFDSVQLQGWGWNDMYGNDPCFQAQVSWYQQNSPGNPIQFIMFPVPYDNNACSSYSTSTTDGHTAGSGEAQQLYGKAVSAGLPVQGAMWWLDIEGADCQSWDPTKASINLSVIQGAVDYLHGQGATVGIYTDSGEWNSFTGSNRTQFAGIPAWNAVPYAGSTFLTVHNDSGQNPYNIPAALSWAQAKCGQASFTGGPLWAVQYMWGTTSNSFYNTTSSPAVIGRDFDYQCVGAPSGPPSIASISGSGKMASTETVTGSNFGGAQGSSYVHLWYSPGHPTSCTTDSTTISWGAPGNSAAFSITGWSNGSVGFQVPTPSGPTRQGNNWVIPDGGVACAQVVTSQGTSNTVSFTAHSPATSSYTVMGYTVGMSGPGVYALAGGNYSLNQALSLVCSYTGGQQILDLQGAMYGTWDLVAIPGGSYNWIWDGQANTPPGGMSTHCSAYPSGNGPPASINVIVGVTGFQMGQPMYLFGSGFGSSIGSGYVHLWTNNTTTGCGNGSTTSTNWGEPGNSAAFTRVGWSDTRVVFDNPTPSGPNQSGTGYQIVPGNMGCVTTINSSGGTTWAGQLVIFNEQSPVTQNWTTSGAANLRSGPSTNDSIVGSASSGQTLTLICWDPNGQSVSGYATWDQLSNGQWVWDGLMNTPTGGPSGLPQCAKFPPDL